MLLNFCFHTALTFAVFAGGINRIKYPIICQAVSASPFHSSHSQSFSENWLWMSIQVSATGALSAALRTCSNTALYLFHASATCIVWSLFKWSGDTMSLFVSLSVYVFFCRLRLAGGYHGPNSILHFLDLFRMRLYIRGLMRGYVFAKEFKRCS